VATCQVNWSVQSLVTAVDTSATSDQVTNTFHNPFFFHFDITRLLQKLTNERIGTIHGSDIELLFEDYLETTFELEAFAWFDRVTKFVQSVTQNGKNGNPIRFFAQICKQHLSGNHHFECKGLLSIACLSD
jgi:hypothetical protein